MCDRTSRFWIYTTVISLLWGHFGIWTSPAGTRFYCWILPMFTLLLLRAFFQPSIHLFLFVGHAFKWKTFFRLSFIVNFEFLTHLFLMLLDDAILFKLLKNFTFSVYFVHKILSHFEISNKVSLHSVYINLVLLDILDWYYICTSF